VVSSGIRPVLWGVGVGVPLAGAAARLVEGVLARSPLPLVAADGWLYLAVALLLAGVGIAAMLIPAVRAAAAGPMRALRQE
jgi:hypothetical protein